MALFKKFHDGKLPLFNLDFRIIMPLPKQKEVRNIKQFQPICLLNLSFKIFTKVEVRSLTGIAEKDEWCHSKTRLQKIIC
jgi:hypothetical protein